MSLFRPFKIIGQIFPVFVLFVIVNLIIGQIGILASIALGIKETTFTARQLFILNLDAGNLYTFSIALIATSFNQYFIDFLVKEEVLYKKYKILLSVVSFLIIILMTLFYAAYQPHSLQQSLPNTTGATIEKKNIDPVQVVFYFLSIILSTYMFCVNFLEIDPESYIEFDDQNILKLKKTSKTLTKDSQGTAI